MGHVVQSEKPVTQLPPECLSSLSAIGLVPHPRLSSGGLCKGHEQSLENMADRHEAALKSAAVTWCCGCRWSFGLCPVFSHTEQYGEQLP